jgi:hypothetical protein
VPKRRDQATDRGGGGAGAQGTVRAGGCFICFEFKFKMVSNQIQIVSNFDRPKKYFPKLEKLEIKYGCEGYE